MLASWSRRRGVLATLRFGQATRTSEVEPPDRVQSDRPRLRECQLARDGRDPHAALKRDVVARVNREGFEAVLARLQWGKGDVAYSLHANPSSFSTSGLQKTDFLAYLGFERRDQCPFTGFNRCYVKWVDEGFNVEAFIEAFQKGYRQLEQAEGALQACGFALPQPEGWGFFYGKRGGGSRPQTALGGDGHTAMKNDQMKQTEDANFQFHFTFITTDHGKGFVTHYRPKHPPLSEEIEKVFHLLGLQRFRDCPEFDFEECHYRTLRFEQRGDDYFSSNVEYAHRSFDAHAGQFSRAIESLLEANAAVKSIGLPFLKMGSPIERNRIDIAKKIVLPKPTKPVTMAFDAALPTNFDVAISFAGSERPLAKDLADRLQQAGIAVFYDDYYPEHLWGKNLTAFLDEICQSAFKFDPRSASNFDPLERRVRAVAFAPSELVGVAETARARVGV